MNYGLIQPMPKGAEIVINTSPLIALMAAWDDLTPLKNLYEKVHVTSEVCREIYEGGANRFAVAEFEQATWLSKKTTPLAISPWLLNSLDLGEASVIQLALDLGRITACIDDSVGRRIARLSGLNLTGSIGILLKAKQQDPTQSVKQEISKMLSQNIRLSQTVIHFALMQAGETAD